MRDRRGAGTLVGLTLVLWAAVQISTARPSAQESPPLEPGLPVGSSAPDFTLKDQHGQDVSLASLLAEGPVALVFYRSADWCMYCKLQLVQLQQHRAEIEAAGARIVGISYDPVEALADFSARSSISFPLLSDAGSRTIDAYQFRAPGGAGIAYHGTFIIDSRGIIRSKLFQVSYRERAAVDGLVQALRKARQPDESGGDRLGLRAAPLATPLYQAKDVNPDPHVFEAYLTADEQDIPIDGTMVHCMVYRDETTGVAGIPAPEIRVHLGDLVILHLRNDLDVDSTSIHWHGIEPDNDSDGTAVSQDAVLPGQSYTYRFRTRRPGLYWYHSHMLPGSSTFAGMYGSIVIESDVEDSLKGSVLPTDADTHSLVLSDIDFDPVTGKVGKVLHREITDINEILQLCALSGEGDPSGDRAACGAVTPGNIVLVNGKRPSKGRETPMYVVESGQRIRLRLFNAAITRHFRLRLVGSGDDKLYRIGGEGGLLDRVQLDGGVKGTWDTKYGLGEIAIGSGERADVLIVPSGAEWTTVRLVGTWLPNPFNLSAGLPDEYPIAFFRIHGVSSDAPPAAGDPILAGTAEDVENIKDDAGVVQLIDPPPGGVGSGNETIRLTTARGPGELQQPSVDGFSAMLDSNAGNGDFLTLPHPPTARFARVGQLLELSVSNDTQAVHPFHLHGFSLQPVRVVANGTPPTTLYTFDYDEFIDSIDVYPRQTLVFRVRLDDRPRFCDSSGFPGDPGPVLAPCAEAPCGGAVGRWLFHCHIFHHSGLGMMGELVVLGPEVGPPEIDCPPDLTLGTDPGQCTATVTLDTPPASGACPIVTLSPPSGSTFPLGTTMVTASATEDDGATSSCAFLVKVEDREPPEVNGFVAASQLWPPNLRMMNVGLAVDASDNCFVEPVQLQVFSDEISALGDATQTSGGELRLRAERDVSGDGRVYLILLTACDAAGNSSFLSRTVVVPSSKSSDDLERGGAEAAAARSFCEANGGAAPPGYSLILDTKQD